MNVVEIRERIVRLHKHLSSHTPEAAAWESHGDAVYELLEALVTCVERLDARVKAVDERTADMKVYGPRVKRVCGTPPKEWPVELGGEG